MPGADVTVTARRHSALEETCALVVADGGNARAIAMNVTDGAQVTAAFQDRTFDIIINAAGVTYDRPALTRLPKAVSDKSFLRWAGRSPTGPG